MTKKPIPTFKPKTNLLRIGAVTLTAAAALLAAGPVLADTMAWTSTSYIVSQDRATGQFQRRGVAMFASGEVATFTLAGQITSFDPKVLTYDVKMVYTFEDGSTLRQEGSGRNEVTTPPRSVQMGSGRLVGGTGRFEGISGRTESTGRALSEWDAINQFKAEFSLPAKK
ncbi:hypothetical protein [Sphaerotilus microaerophilus]|uniref:Lipopolysaccharide export system protein LptA n=1 Tax=Sphaerotilus microaerophilus TaxID=2914710 RepID=A0ABM7YI20_9BURK|nr:hypothetical protein [Sphaerotilus sp. FB-5]BDI04152.1 hypothetical protein CATMQ487_11220 [Sphaerotilus sp. FB-5]